jgi:hypothetical protein
MRSPLGAERPLSLWQSLCGRVFVAEGVYLVAALGVLARAPQQELPSLVEIVVMVWAPRRSALTSTQICNILLLARESRASYGNYHMNGASFEWLRIRRVSPSGRTARCLRTTVSAGSVR